MPGRARVQFGAECWQDRDFTVLGLLRAVLFLGETKVAVALHLWPEAHRVGNPNARVEEQRQRKPRLGAARVSLLVLPNFLARPCMESIGVIRW